jgi:hypothetical protein
LNYKKIITKSLNKKTKEYYEIIVDEEDYDVLKDLFIVVSFNFYGDPSIYFKYKDSKGKVLTKNIARFLLKIAHLRKCKDVVKYINGNKFDLRKENLELVNRTKFRLENSNSSVNRYPDKIN